MEFNSHGVQVDCDVSSAQHNHEAAAHTSATTGTLLLSTIGLVSVWLGSALWIPFPEKESYQLCGINVCEGVRFVVSALFWWYDSQTSTSSDVQRTLLRRQSCVYGIAPFVNFEEQPVQLRILFTVVFEKSVLFAEPNNIELKHS